MGNPLPPDASDIAIMRFRTEIMEQQMTNLAKDVREMRDELRDVIADRRHEPEKIETLEMRCSAIESEVDTLRAIVDQARGASRATLFWAATISGVVGLAVSALTLWRG